jgi:hypothetical protein
MRAVPPNLGHKGALVSAPVGDPVGRHLHDTGVPPGTATRAADTGRGKGDT